MTEGRRSCSRPSRRSRSGVVSLSAAAAAEDRRRPYLWDRDEVATTISKSGGSSSSMIQDADGQISPSSLAATLTTEDRDRLAPLRCRPPSPAPGMASSALSRLPRWLVECRLPAVWFETILRTEKAEPGRVPPARPQWRSVVRLVRAASRTSASAPCRSVTVRPACMERRSASKLSTILEALAGLDGSAEGCPYERSHSFDGNWQSPPRRMKSWRLMCKRRYVSSQCQAVKLPKRFVMSAA
mmetsp:Transcript_72506/g.235525  ORF Transcript_72506/g.235525 Transcript_72506/m.235525 type:complete len:242 (-) Transcript_72506:1265-1990(-)